MNALTRSLLTLGLALAAPAALAGGSGTANDTTLKLEYTGGPYVAPNPTNGAGAADPICEDGQPTCDVYKLKLDLSDQFRADNLDAFLDAVIEWPNDQSDFDLYFYDSSGAILAKSEATSGGIDAVSMPIDSLPNGDYQVRVTTFAPLGHSIKGTITVSGLAGEAKSGLAGMLAGGLGLWSLAPLALLLLRRRFS